MRLLIAGLIAAIHATALAGAPDGLQLLVLGTPNAAVQKANIEQFFVAYSADPGGFDCDNRQLNIQDTVQHSLRAITPNMASAAVGDSTQRKSFSKALSKYRDQDHDRGFDGALLYDVIAGTLVFYGISAWNKKPIQKIELPVGETNDKRKFNLAICRALHMPVLMTP